jgi:hypothetical protein
MLIIGIWIISGVLYISISIAPRRNLKWVFNCIFYVLHHLVFVKGTFQELTVLPSSDKTSSAGGPTILTSDEVSIIQYHTKLREQRAMQIKAHSFFQILFLFSVLTLNRSHFLEVILYLVTGLQVVMPYRFLDRYQRFFADMLRLSSGLKLYISFHTLYSLNLNEV